MQMRNILISAAMMIATGAHAQSPEAQARAELAQVQVDIGQAVQQMRAQAAKAQADMTAAQLKAQGFQEQAAADAQQQRTIPTVPRAQQQ